MERRQLAPRKGQRGKVTFGARGWMVLLLLVLFAFVVLTLVQRQRPVRRDSQSTPTAGQLAERDGAPPSPLPDTIAVPRSPERPKQASPQIRSRSSSRSAPAEAAELTSPREPGAAALPVPSVSPPPDPVSPLAGTIEPATPLPSAVEFPPPPPSPDVVPEVPRISETESAALFQILGRYEQAYDRRDATSAAAIWPSVDSRALARAFARLRYQDLDFGDCTFAVSDRTATAHCAGELRYTRLIGDTAPKSEQHVWTIEFLRKGEMWQIAGIKAQ